MSSLIIDTMIDNSFRNDSSTVLENESSNFFTQAKDFLTRSMRSDNDADIANIVPKEKIFFHSCHDSSITEMSDVESFMGEEDTSLGFFNNGDSKGNQSSPSLPARDLTAAPHRRRGMRQRQNSIRSWNEQPSSSRSVQRSSPSITEHNSEESMAKVKQIEGGQVLVAEATVTEQKPTPSSDSLVDKSEAQKKKKKNRMLPWVPIFWAMLVVLPRKSRTRRKA
ncbi:unnamed protein product [Cylindrotheca closterium]|uniref:Uncharacterized protein n=1 Tax=Cylindrotheca closterium TaxID=2856 RepID=A0AAD2G0J6_9STRA|nr:unnamed protein product [Cylindrotheca closterium]